MKRLIGIVLSSIALIVLMPLFAVIMVILRFTGEGHIFFLQPRVGRNGRTFGLIKFSTMLKDSPNILNSRQIYNKDRAKNIIDQG
jgi:lipopolysaccharide/colanic/teichoic acid biosynthesis glycosyltransferase